MTVANIVWTCDYIASLYQQPVATVQALNPKLDCSKPVPRYALVCVEGGKHLYGILHLLLM
jgi:hypothetical protein